MSDLNKIQLPNQRLRDESSSADDVCWTHCSGVVVQMTQNEFAQFALGQILALGLAAFLLAVIIIIIDFPAYAAQQATTTAPKAQNTDPIAGGFATPLAGRDRPDALTGAELIRKRFDLLKQVVPGVVRVAVLWQPTPDVRHSMTALQDVGKAAWALGLHLRFVAADDVPQLEVAFSDISTGQVDAIMVLSSRMPLLERKYIVQLVAKTGLPAIYDAREFVENGGLMSYGPNLSELDEYNTPDPDKMTDKGNSTPVDQTIKLELVLNLKTARKLGISLNPEFIALVDKLIE
jgi:putative tryptophan/tyrosine transport system substrate-binding protein